MRWPQQPLRTWCGQWSIPDEGSAPGYASGRPDPTTGARAVPIHKTTSFGLESAADLAAAITERTWFVFCEVVSNRLCMVADTMCCGISIRL